MKQMSLEEKEIQYLLSLVLTRYQKLSKSQQNVYDNDVKESLLEETAVLLSLYNKIKELNEEV